MTNQGYSLSSKSKTYHALDSFVFEYTNQGGMPDNIKIEINYMLRNHVLPLVKKEISFDWFNKPVTVTSINPIEILATKIVALLSRAAPRDLYDVNNLLNQDMLSNHSNTLRKCVIFYSTIASDNPQLILGLSKINHITEARIKRELLPMLKKGEYFHFQEIKMKICEVLAKLLTLTDLESLFIEEFKNRHYVPELLFEDINFYENIKHHPMALWKCKNDLV